MYFSTCVRCPKRNTVPPEKWPFLLLFPREPLGEWKSLGDPCVGSPDQNKTVRSQPNFVLAVPGHAGCYVFMADRWDQTKIGHTNTEIHASRLVLWATF